MPLHALTIVGKLTSCAPGRHEFDARSRFVAGFLSLLACGIVQAQAKSQWQATDDIAATAEQHLRESIGTAAGRTRVIAGTLDSRHRLALCSQPLEAFLRRGTEVAARTIVGVRCSGEKPWKVYVPVDVVVTDAVLVARRTLPHGHALGADDFRIEQRDVSRQLSGYISSFDELSGQRLKNSLIAGRMLTPAMLQAAIAVKRGQTVTLTAKSAVVDIQMSGKALADGALNQRIRVENLQSGRVVEGIVRSREHVEVLMGENGPGFHAKAKVSPAVADTGSGNNDR